MAANTCAGPRVRQHLHSECDWQVIPDSVESLRPLRLAEAGPSLPCAGGQGQRGTGQTLIVSDEIADRDLDFLLAATTDQPSQS